MKHIDSRAQGPAWGSLTPAQPAVSFLRKDGKAVGRTERVEGHIRAEQVEEEDRIETAPRKCLQAPDIELQTPGWAALVSHIAGLLRKTVTNPHSA